MATALRAGDARSRSATAAVVPAGASSAGPARLPDCFVPAEQLLRPGISTAPDLQAPRLVAGPSAEVVRPGSRIWATDCCPAWSGRDGLTHLS